MRKLRMFAGVVAVVCLVSRCPPKAHGEGDGKPVRPFITLGGRDSKITRAGYHRIESPQAWKVLWLRHTTGSGAEPRNPMSVPQAEVDFNRCMVVAAFQGQGELCNGFKVHSVFETDEQITVRIQRLGFAVGGVEVPKTRAWGIFVLPRSTKLLRVELDTRREKVAPPKWTQVAEFKAGNGSREK